MLLILVWGANFSVQKMVFNAMSPGGFLMVRYLVMSVAAALLLCWRFGRRWPRVPRADLLAILKLGIAGHLLHPLVDGIFQLADPRLRPAVHPADPAHHRRRDADARPGGRRGGGARRRAAVPVGQAARRLHAAMRDGENRGGSDAINK
jgi:EamA-like transporter family